MSALVKLLKKTNKWAKDYFSEHSLMLVVVISYFITFLNEAMSRRSVWEAVVFLFTQPFMFVCNMAIIAIFASLALISRKRKFWLWAVSLFFFGIGLTNFILMFNRITPFSAKDFTLVRSVYPIIPVYLGVFGTVLAAAALLGAIIGLVILYFKTNKEKVNYKKACITFLVCVLTATVCIGGGTLAGAIPNHFSSLPEAYKNHGFNLCFSISVLDVGISKPKDYDDKIDDVVSDILGDGEDQTQTKPESTPNIIFVQLESFYDFSLLEGFSFSEDPTPIFSKLRQSCTSGLLTVPSIGAGTANTEFEILSGMSLKYFGAGEYPYETILQKKTCESIAFLLKDYGYTSHAVHNYKANFYSRKNAFSKLGFDTFTSIEYMNGLTYNQNGWANDGVLTEYVFDSLLSTEGPDFVQCITVQAHGVYPTTSYEGEEDEKIKVTSLPEGANAHSYSYFVNQIHQTDKFIGELISGIQALGEDTVVVFYSDHIPNIGIEEEWLPSGMTLFNTEYVIWRSDGVSSESKNITSYQLSYEVLSSLDLNCGVMGKLHGKRSDMSKSEYDLNLHMLQYDLLYGDCVAYGGENPFKATDIKLGINDIVIDDVYIFGENIYVKGEGFTESSKIFVNGVQKETEFIDSQTMILHSSVKNGDKVKVVQVADIIFHLSSTEQFVYNVKTDD